MPHLTSTVHSDLEQSQTIRSSSSVLLRNLKMASFIQPMTVLVTTFLVLEATCNPVAQPVQYEGTNVGALVTEYTTEVQYLHATVDYLRQILVSQLINTAYYRFKYARKLHCYSIPTYSSRNLALQGSLVRTPAVLPTPTSQADL